MDMYGSSTALVLPACLPETRQQKTQPNRTSRIYSILRQRNGTKARRRLVRRLRPMSLTVDDVRERTFRRREQDDAIVLYLWDGYVTILSTDMPPLPLPALRSVR